METPWGHKVPWVDLFVSRTRFLVKANVPKGKSGYVSGPKFRGRRSTSRPNSPTEKTGTSRHRNLIHKEKLDFCFREE